MSDIRERRHATLVRNEYAELDGEGSEIAEAVRFEFECLVRRGDTYKEQAEEANADANTYLDK